MQISWTLSALLCTISIKTSFCKRHKIMLSLDETATELINWNAGMQKVWCDEQECIKSRNLGHGIWRHIASCQLCDCRVTNVIRVPIGWQWCAAYYIWRLTAYWQVAAIIPFWLFYSSQAMLSYFSANCLRLPFVWIQVKHLKA